MQRRPQSKRFAGVPESVRGTRHIQLIRGGSISLPAPLARTKGIQNATR